MKRKLTDNDVRHMRQMHEERRALMQKADALTITKIAEKFEVSYTTAYDAIYKYNYCNVED